VDAPNETRDFAKFFRWRLTLPEGLLWRAIKGGKAEGLKFRKQHPIGPYVLDFYCAELRLCVEVDGSSHSWAIGRTKRRAGCLVGRQRNPHAADLGEPGS
jgi:very-short-patch-repair endonuclease